MTELSCKRLLLRAFRPHRKPTSKILSTEATDEPSGASGARNSNNSKSMVVVMSIEKILILAIFIDGYE
ncbi:MAG: hypothetical protein WCE81_05080 [Halobacteriota archaeon]